MSTNLPSPPPPLPVALPPPLLQHFCLSFFIACVKAREPGSGGEVGFGRGGGGGGKDRGAREGDRGRNVARETRRGGGRGDVCRRTKTHMCRVYISKCTPVAMLRRERIIRMHLEGRVGGGAGDGERATRGSEVNERVQHNRHAAREFHGCGLLFPSLFLSFSLPPSSYAFFYLTFFFPPPFPFSL